jgi:outer membrane immunogenic protein
MVFELNEGGVVKKVLVASATFLALATTAFAADLPAAPYTKAPAFAPVLFSWTGCYIGVEGGGNWGQSQQTSRTAPLVGVPITGNYNLSGGIVGGTVGCNYQVSNFVVGIENDFSWTNKKGSAVNVAPFDPANISTTREKWIDTLRGRFGYGFDRFMIYGTAGAAFAGTDVTVSGPALGTFTNSQNRTGWTAGVGGEWAALVESWGAVTFKVEYLHADFGTKQYFNPPVAVGNATVVTRDVKLTDDMVRAGVNVKFNWGGPIISKY